MGMVDGAVLERDDAELDASATRLVAIAAVAGPGASLLELTALAGIDHDEAHARLVAHAAIARRFAGDTRPAAVLRCAEHALAAAPLSAAHAEDAIAAARRAAPLRRRALEFAAAASLLERAVAVEHALPHVPERACARAALLVERAEAVLDCGRLTEARAAFSDAAEAAEACGSPELLAAAALGLGGVWLNEHRDGWERGRVLELQRRALAALPATDDPAVRALRCRLRVRLAAETIYDEVDITAVPGLEAALLAELDAARACGDARARAEGLSLVHHALLGPEHARTRLAIADELIEVATGAGEGVLALMGLMWRVVDLVHLGDPRADRALAELRRRSDALDCRSILYVVSAMDVMRLVRRGHLDQAEAAAAASWELGLEVGDADATGYYGAHLLSLRWMQGRETELLASVEELTDSPTLTVANVAFVAAHAWVAARAGQADAARASLARLRANRGLAALPRFSGWLVALVCVIEAARELGDAEVASEAAALLAPYADQVVAPSLAISCLGSVERSLGVAALVTGAAADAVAHLERAVEANRNLGNRPMLAIARADLAEALAAVGQCGRADELVAEAVAEARGMGMDARADTWSRRATPVAARPAGGAPTLERDGNRWSLSLAGRQVSLPDLVGVRYLQVLVEQPGRELSALELCAAADPAAAEVAGAAGRQRRQEVLDTKALAAYRRRADDLAAAIERAEDAGDAERADALTAERDALRTEVQKALAVGGRSRAFADPGERARTAVRKALKRVIELARAADPVLGDQLAAALTTGSACRFEVP